MTKSNQAQKGIDQLFVDRFCARDATLWAENESDKEEIGNRLAWLDAAQTGIAIIPSIERLLNELLLDGFTHAVVLGMGGSSLAPEVFSEIFKNSVSTQTKKLELSILDSTDPDQIIEKRRNLPIIKTLFIVSSKSGGTAEVNALEAYFWDELTKAGIQYPGSHFIAITDPGTTLEKKGKEKHYRLVIQANPNVGGRYSALIEFGLVPAILMGVDVKKLLTQAQKMEIDCGSFNAFDKNPGVILGNALAKAYFSGKDKLTLVADDEVASIGSWIEQLVAESSGKDGKGILPIDLEPQKAPELYGDDRIFVYLKFSGQHSEFTKKLINLGKTVITLEISNCYNLGGEFMRWEIATCVVCALIGVNAFNQPNVQLSKSITQEMIVAIKMKSRDITQIPSYIFNDSEIFGDFDVTNKPDACLTEVLSNFLKQSETGDFIAINAFIPRDAMNEVGLQNFRKRISIKTNLPTTLGFGPRFLHSTGQLHKGGKNNGLFLIITRESNSDFDIPGGEMTFGTLQNAQAIGDMRALKQQNRRVLRLHFKNGSYLPDLNKIILA